MSTCKPCRHIMPTGRNCQSPAMRGSAYCYFHHGPQKSARRKSKSMDATLELEPISDPAGVSLNADHILRALASNQISSGKAAILFQGLQTVLASFRLPPVESRDFPPGESDLAPTTIQPKRHLNP
jgi:hypothetical protein